MAAVTICSDFGSKKIKSVTYDYTVEVTHKFKGIDLIECLKTMDGGPYPLYRRRWSKPSPRKRNAKCKMVVWGGLTNSWEKKRCKRLRRKERYTHLNAQFQRIARRDKKAFLTDQCKVTEENNRMGKTSALFKKIRDSKGTFHVKMGTIKDRNGMELTEADNIKKKEQEYTEDLYKKRS